MSESQAREEAASEPLAWVEIPEGAIAWIAEGHPEWWTSSASRPEPRPLLSRIIADTGIPKGVLYRVAEQEGIPGPIALDANSLGRFIAGAAEARGVRDHVAFSRVVRIVRARDLAEAAA